jgi:predicted nucleotidyltransferase
MIPDEYKKDIEIAVSVLKENGAKEVYLFGSLADGSASAGSDIDLAVTGIPAAAFFEVYSRSSRALSHAMDLVDLDHETEMACFLRETDRLVQVG